MRIVVIGGGIAGVSVAAELSRQHHVTLLEMEEQLAHHTTGRSAAMYLGSYGNSIIQALTSGSFELYQQLSSEYGHLLLLPRDMVQVLDHSQLHEVDATLADNPTMGVIPVDELMAMAPYIRRDVVGAVLRDTSGFDIDVAGLHQTYVRLLTANDGIIQKSSQVWSITYNGAIATVTTLTGATHEADMVVNAAGAWGDHIAQRASCREVHLKPLRRTIFTSRFQEDLPPGPMVVRHPEEFYFRVDRGIVLGSPADESPSDPCDAQPEELDVARAIEAINEFTTLNIRSVESTWAGLRTFAPDKSPVMGCNEDEPWFFWLCGQGGYGIQMAPKLASLAADVVNDAVASEEVVLARHLSPTRFP